MDLYYGAIHSVIKDGKYKAYAESRNERANEAWQRAFDNVLEGVDEMIVSALYDTVQWVKIRDYVDLYSDVDELF